MENVLVFTFPEDRVFHGRIQLDLKTDEQHPLNDQSPIVFVTPTKYLCRFMVKHFFAERDIQAHLNIDKSGAIPVIALYLHMPIVPPIELDDHVRQMVSYCGDLISWPDTDSIGRVLFGAVFAGNPEIVKMVKDHIATSGKFYTTIAAEDQPGRRVLTMNDAPVVSGSRVTYEPLSMFLEHIMAKPAKPWNISAD